jgi:hypothetical protein
MGASLSRSGNKSAVYLMQWMEGRMEKKLGMLAGNMRVQTVNVRQRMGIMTLYVRHERGDTGGAE